MSKLNEVVIDYDAIIPAKAGEYLFSDYAQQIPDNSDKMSVNIQYSDFTEDDVSAKLVQSVDGATWQDVDDSAVAIDISLTSHTWNLAGYTPGLYIAVFVDTGTNTTGSVTQIKYLT